MGASAQSVQFKCSEHKHRHTETHTAFWLADIYPWYWSCSLSLFFFFLHGLVFAPWRHSERECVLMAFVSASIYVLIYSEIIYMIKIQCLLNITRLIILNSQVNWWTVANKLPTNSPLHLYSIASLSLLISLCLFFSFFVFLGFYRRTHEAVAGCSPRLWPWITAFPL